MTALNKQARQVQRYTNYGVDVMEWDDGTYVKYSDYLARLDELEAAEHTAAVDHEAACSLVEENEEVKRKLEAAEKRIAELETRNPYGYLRENDGQIQISIGSNRPHDRSGSYATPWFAIYTAAGIGVKGE
ncbi:hypothetical protein A6Y39_12825 [Salmonella enterica]|nr:hypothetical protein [Salmonella enterica]EJZ4300507.1 hypothetical protein [Salmonella enterica subsp. enterica serovar Altona]